MTKEQPSQFNAELLAAFSEYQATFQRTTASELGGDLRPGKEADGKFIDTVLKIQRQLKNNQVLVIRVALGEKDADFEEIDGYAGYVHDAPILFGIVVKKELEAEHIVIEGIDSNHLPKLLDIIIPQNVIPKTQDDVFNTSYSRDLVMSGKVKRFLYRQDFRLPALQIVPKGVILTPTIHLLPSIIKDIRIDTIENIKPNRNRQVIFRVVAE